MSSLKLPDLRFEETFLKSLYSEAGQNEKDPEELAAGGLSDKQLRKYNKKLDTMEEKELHPITPITPSIVMYVILKDQIIKPLLQGFLWSGLLILSRPLLSMVVLGGQRCGIWVSNMVGLNKLAVHRPATRPFPGVPTI